MPNRMLNKDKKPSFDDMIEYCQESGSLWHELRKFLQQNYNLEK